MVVEILCLFIDLKSHFDGLECEIEGTLVMAGIIESFWTLVIFRVDFSKVGK